MNDPVTPANAESVGPRTSEAPFAAADGYAVRVKLFAAFALTALWSLYRPSETKQMIDDWSAAERKRSRDRFIARMFNRPHTEKGQR